MKEQDWELQVDTGTQDGISNLGHGARHEEACGNDADHGSEGQDGLDEFGEELVGRHPNGDGSEDDLNGRLGNPRGIHGHDRAQNGLAQERRHQNRPHRRGRGHEHGKRDIPLRDVRAQIARLSAVDAPHQHHAGHQSRLEAERPAQEQREGGHHGVAQRELHEDRAGLGCDGDEVRGGQRDPHGEHEGGERGREVLGGEEVEAGGFFEGEGGEEDGP
mmetsp:Transcript_879/g.2126  ORF Transcript_879/g.2126 Transcript_879/m.2126 type:complete len:218 (+) Transcript_879:627-1280(+)